MRTLLFLVACSVAAATAQDVKTYVNSSETVGLLVENQGSYMVNKTAIRGDAGVSSQGIGVEGTGYNAGVHATSSNRGLWAEGNPAVEASGISSYGSTGLISYAQQGYYNMAVVGQADNGYQNYGVTGFASAPSTSEYAYAIYGYAPATTNSWAGYFDGNVDVIGSFSNSSDIKLKKNIRPIENGLGAILKLRPKTYEFNTDIKEVNLSKGTHLGLIAQDVETVLPSLVSTSTVPSKRDPEDAKKKTGPKKETYSFKTVNYLELIPVLIKGMQEQQAVIENLQAEVARLKAR